MLRKFHKKSIVVLFMIIAMVISIVVNVSASGDGGYGIASGECSHGYPGIGAYAWSPDNFQAMAVMEAHTGCNAVKITAVLILSSNGKTSFLYPTANGIITNGSWEANIDYTPPSGTIIIAAVASFTCCNVILS